MSQLGDEIRDQQRAARRVSQALDDEARNLRSRVQGAMWESGAGGFFRAAVGSYLVELDGVRREVDRLVDELGHHADTVENHEDTVHDVVSWPARLVGLG